MRAVRFVSFALVLASWAFAPRFCRAEESDAGSPADAAAIKVPVACGGALCRTSNGSTCSISPDAPTSFASSVLPAVALLLVLRRRAGGRARGLSWGALVGAFVAFVPRPSGATTAAPVAATEPAAIPAKSEPPVDVVIHDTTPRKRIVSIEWNPIALFAIGKLSGNVVVTPADHHALVVSPFYAWANTVPLYTFDSNGNATQLPEQKFRGFGAELGYRYYFDRGGPRGFFVGPSFVLGAFTAKAMNGQTTDYANIGFAADTGYQMLVADSVALALGGGLEATWTSHSIPPQQFPARIYANDGVRPRVLLSLGWAF
jgi:hypothetical protein